VAPARLRCDSSRLSLLSEEGTGDPVELPFCCPVQPAADRSGIPASRLDPPPHTDEVSPLAPLNSPLLTQATSLPALWLCPPPLTAETGPLAVLKNPPLTTESMPRRSRSMLGCSRVTQSPKGKGEKNQRALTGTCPWGPSLAVPSISYAWLYNSCSAG
jgi:hypothetical protein